MEAARKPLPTASRSFRFWCAATFPLLMLAAVIGNQQWRIGPFLWGQMISWIVDIGGIVILVRFMKRKYWGYLLLVAIVLTRAAGSGFRGSATIDMVYLALLNLLFLIVGAIIAATAPDMARKQVRWICLFSLVFMVLQVTGVGEWTQFLALENNGAPKTAYPTLFVPEDRLIWQVIQARPSGLFYSNNFLSLIVLFGLALNFSDERTNKLNRWDVAMLMMAVLSMAKIVFLGTAMIIGWLVFFGRREQRGRMWRAVGLLLVFFVAYRILFPGLFSYQVNFTHFAYSFFIRVNEFVEKLDPRSPFVRFITPYLYNTPVARWDTTGGLSGYSKAMRWLPYLAVAAMVGLPVYFGGLRRVRKALPKFGTAPVLVAIVAVVLPAAVPIWASPVYWFIAGFGALPLIVGVMPTLLTMRKPAPASSRAARTVRVQSHLAGTNPGWGA